MTMATILGTGSFKMEWHRNGDSICRIAIKSADNFEMIKPASLNAMT